MIGKAELLGVAGALRLNPHIVEKDYALGWVLAGIFAHPTLAESWVFKGGTCHTWNIDRNAHRSYRVDRIHDARMTNRSFTPRYAVELSPSGPVLIPPTPHSHPGTGTAGGLG